MQTVDPLLPMSVIIHRYESLIQEYLRYKRDLRWWQFRRRYAVKVVITAFEEEIRILTELSAKYQPIIGQHWRSNIAE